MSICLFRTDITVQYLSSQIKCPQQEIVLLDSDNTDVVVRRRILSLQYQDVRTHITSYLLQIRALLLHIRCLPSLRLRAQLYFSTQRLYQHELPALRSPRQVLHLMLSAASINLRTDSKCFRSSKNTPYHCGFFLQIWDQLFNTTYPEEKGHFAAEDARRAH